MSESTPPPASSSPTDPTPPAPQKKKRRLWLKILLGLVVLVILLVLLAPTIISMGFVKNIVVGQVNNQLNGHIEIADWSIGWTSGVRVDGIKVYDASNAQIAQVKSFSTQLSLLSAARMNIALGDTIVDSPNFDAKILPDGTINFASLLKTSPSAPKPPAPPAEPHTAKSTEPTKLPKVSGHFKLVNCTGTVEQGGQTLYITGIDADAVIVDLNQPITHTATIAMKVDNGTPGKITVKGDALAVKNDVVDLNAANVNEAVTIESIDLPGLAPFIPPSVGVVPKSGVINGQLTMNVKDGKSAGVSGQINGTDIQIAGDALKGDTYATKVFAVNIPPLTVTMPNGPNDVNAMTAQGDPITINWDQGSVAATIDLPLSGVMNLAASKAPAATGSVNVDAKVDLGKLAVMLPHLVHVQDGTTVTGGQFHQTVNLALADKNATFALTTDLTNIAGKSATGPIGIQPINVKIGGEVDPAGNWLDAVRNVNLTLASAFANANLSAPTLSQVKGQATGELAKVQSEFGQLIDFGQLHMAGSFAADINSSADPNDLTKPADIDAKATLTNLNITGLPDQSAPVTEPWMGATLHAQVLGINNGVTAVKDISVTAKTGQTNPSLDFAMNANVDLTNGLAADYTIKTCNIILPQLQKELGPLVAALRTAPDLGLGTLAVASSGKVTQTTDKADPSKNTLDASISALSVTESTGLLSITQVNPITVKLVGKNISPAGKLQITADLVKLSDIAQKATAGKATVAVNGKQAKLNNGKLTGTVELASVDAKTMSVAVDMSAADLSVDTAGGPTERETITFGLKTTPAADFSAINNTSVYVKSQFANVDVSDVAVDLPAAPAGAKGPALPVVKSAKLTVDVADVGPLQTLLTAISPAPADPNNPPITVPRGSIKVDGNISHDGTNTVLTISDISTKDLRLQKGAAIYKVKDVTIAITAKADISGDTTQTLADQFRQVSITQLTGHLGIAELTMPQPIVISKPLGAMNAAGSVAVSGEITDITTLLETLAGKNPGELYPYSGHYALTENLSTNGNTVSPKGTIDVTNFQMLQDGKPVVSEPKISIANDLGVDLVNHNAKINDLSVNMPSSGALVLDVKGGVTDWVTKRQIDAIVVKFTGDWTPLWTLVKPLVPPANQAMIADLKLTGKFDRTINVSGSYPDGMTMQQAIKLLSADGSVTIANIDWPSMGVTASNAEIPFYLDKGILRLVYAGRPEGQNAASPFTVNNGTIHLEGIAIDLTQADPRLNTPKNYQIVQKIGLNNVLAAKCGKYIPLFSNASEASGLVSVEITSCDKLPLSNLVTESTKANDGTIAIVYNVQQVQIASPVVTAILAIMSKSEAGNSLRGDINNATINVANGEVKQDTTLSLGAQQGRGIRLAGGVNMTTLKLDDFFVNLSPLLLKSVSSSLSKYLPAGIDIALKGTVTSPQLDVGNSINKMVADAGKKAAVDGLLGGGHNNGKNTGNTPSTQQASPTDDTINDLKDLFGKKKKKK